MFPTNNTPASGSTPTNQPAQNQPQSQNQNQPDFVTKDEFGRTAAFIRGLKDTVEALQKSMPTLDTFVSLGMLERVDDGTYKPKPAQQAAHSPAQQPQHQQSSNTAEPEWKQAVDALKKSLKAKDDELAAERQRAADGERKNAVISALARAGAVNPDRDAVHVLNGIQKNDKGQYVSRAKDDLGLDIEVSLEDFVTKFLQTNPELKKASGHAGSGTPAEPVAARLPAKSPPSSTWRTAASCSRAATSKSLFNWPRPARHTGAP